MKRSTWLILAALLFSACGTVYADNCSAAFDHSGACGRNCLSANPGCGLQGCIALCSGTAGVVATSQTATVAAVNPNNAILNRGVNAVGVNRGAFNREALNRDNVNRENVNRGNVDRASVSRGTASRGSAGRSRSR